MLKQDILFSKAPPPKLSDAQSRILSHLQDHMDDAAYLSSAQLAEKLGISNATVVRFCQHLGFRGYPDLQNRIRQEIKTRLKVHDRILKRPPYIREAKDFLKTVLKSDRDNLSNALKTVSEDLFAQLVEEIHSHQEIWVLGLRSCHGAAHYFATNLGFLSRRANLISLDAGAVWSHIMPGLNKDALVVAVSFPRHSQTTLDIAQTFYKAGAKIAAITDSHASPLASMGTWVFPLPFWIDSYFESNVAVVSFFNAVLAGVSFLDGQKTVTQLQALEEVWAEKNVYHPSEALSFPSWADRFHPTDNKEKDE